MKIRATRDLRILSTAAFVYFMLFFPVVTGAGEDPPEVIRFNGTAGRPMEAPGVYPRIYSGAVEFGHKSHYSADGRTCGDCHHDDSAEPRSDLKAGMEVDNCIDCHDGEGLVYGRAADEMDDGDLIEHRANVMHRLCVGCHTRSTAEAKALVAPLACRGCHAQRSRNYVIR